MNIWAVIPVQPLEEGKSRLAGVLSAPERFQLNQRFFTHVLKTAVTVFPPSRVIVVSRSADVLRAAGDAQTLSETGSGDLNVALTEAARAARRLGAEAVLSLSSDLPVLETADLQAMCAAMAADTAVIAPDRAGVGTNAMLCPVKSVAYAYGESSFARHQALMEAQDLGVIAMRREGLAFDIDTPADLERLRNLRPGF
ncbi:MAG: 2-phospho-L-lactate guanylyltransferase [Rhodospirillaceae bacterium]|nr:2-phospho-L-lactate guanylyltransferase [Rhodospirillaceae bacterium]